MFVALSPHRSWPAGKIPGLVEFGFPSAPLFVGIPLSGLPQAQVPQFPYLHTATVILERGNHPECEIRRGV